MTRANACMREERRITMTEKIQKRLLDLKAAQDADQPMRCPRCGA